MKGDFGVCLQGTHPDLKEGTECSMYDVIVYARGVLWGEIKKAHGRSVKSSLFAYIIS